MKDDRGYTESDARPDEVLHFGGKRGDRRLKSKTESMAEDMVKDGKSIGLKMEIEKG